MPDFTVLYDVMVPMRDGVRLATDIYLPDSAAGQAAERLPALLTRTPYDKNAEATPPADFQMARPSVSSFASYFASNGYVAVVQSVRGRYRSEGAWRMLWDDANDGVDTCAWIAEQGWSDGTVGMYGTSYPGGMQHIVALAGAPQLKTVIPVDAVSNVGRHGMRYAGAFELRFWNWVVTGGNNVSWKGVRTESRDALSEMATNRTTYLRHLPTRRGTTPLKHVPEYEGWLVDAMSHAADDEFWSQINILEDPRCYQDMPVYLVGGWYDSWGINTTANYVALKGALRGPVYLIMGPWIHGHQGSYAHGQVNFGKDAAISEQMAWRLEWFDKWLKGRDNAVGKAAPFATPVRIFVMGTGDGSRCEDGRLFHGGYWREEEEWPLARTRYTPFYLQPDGGLSTSRPAAVSASTSFDFDPRDPVPSIGGNVSSAEGIMVMGAWDQRGNSAIFNWQEPLPLSVRSDVLVFQSEPLSEDTEVTGEIAVKLWASSSAVDTDFTAKLIDVYPPSPDFPGGFDLNLEDGIVRARFRDSLVKEELMTPGQVYEFTIDLYPTSNVFKKGHRIRLDISSSNFPRFDANPNTGDPLNQHRRAVVATNTVFHDARHPSHILLPIIPA